MDDEREMGNPAGEQEEPARPGRKPDPVRAELRKRLSYLSDRNFGTLWVTYRRLLACQKQGGLTAEEVKQCVDSTRWRDGRINVIEFERAGIALLMKAREEHPELFRSESRPHPVKEFQDGRYVVRQDGDETVTGTPGPSRDELKAHQAEWRERLGEVSKGTFDAFWVMYRKLMALERNGSITAEQMEGIVADAYSNPDGTMNVTRFCRNVKELQSDALYAKVDRSGDTQTAPEVTVPKLELVPSPPEEMPEDGSEAAPGPSEPEPGTIVFGTARLDVTLKDVLDAERVEKLERLAQLLMDPASPWGEIMQLRRETGL